MAKIKIGVLTASDRASDGVYADESGKAIKAYLSEKIESDISFEYLLVKDSYESIKQGLVSLADKHNCSLIVTTGGTGPSPRDVTPEATEAACSKLLPGFGELMRAESLKFVPTAILSRQTAGIRGNALIINLPGKPKAIRQCLDAIYLAIPDCVKIIGGPAMQLRNNETQIFH